MVGGLLYSIGGYFLPFMTLGLLLFLTAIITMCILPKHNDTCQQGHANGEFKGRYAQTAICNMCYDSDNGHQRVFVSRVCMWIELMQFWFLCSFNSVIDENSRCNCVWDEHYGNECINWIPWRNAWTTFETIRSWTNSTWWVLDSYVTSSDSQYPLTFFCVFLFRLGVVFIINGGFYALTAPIWGWMVDQFLNPKVSACIGSLLIITAFCLIGPASFIPIEPWVPKFDLNSRSHCQDWKLNFRFLIENWERLYLVWYVMALALRQCWSPVSQKHSERQCKFHQLNDSKNEIAFQC